MTTADLRSSSGYRAALNPLLPVLFAFGCSGPSPEPRDMSLDADTTIVEPVVLPLLHPGLPIVECVIEAPDGSRQMLRGLLDTGADSTLIDLGFAESIGLLLHEFDGATKRGDSVTDVRTIPYLAEVDVLHLGEARAEQMALGCLNLGLEIVDVQAIVGQDVLGDWQMLFEFDRERVHMFDGDVVDYMADLFVGQIPAQRFDCTCQGRRLYVRGGAAGLSVEYLVDTGATGCSIPSTVVEAAKLTPTGESSESINIAHTTQVEYFRLDDLQLGSFHVGVDVKPTADERGGLGYDVLSSFVFVIDSKNSQLYLIDNPRRRDE